MNREMFLSRLFNKLKWEMSLDEASDVIGDYSEYFDVGLAQGKSEQELCEEFGTPKQIAASIFDERKANWHPRLGRVRRIIIGLVLIFYPALIFWADFYELLYPILSRFWYIVIVAAPVLILFATGQLPFSHHRAVYASKRKSLLNGSLLIVCVMLTSLCGYLLCSFTMDLIATYPNHVVERVYTVYNTCVAAVIASTAAWLVLVVHATSVSRYFSCAYFLYSGFLLSIIGIINDLGTLNFEEVGGLWILDIFLADFYRPLVVGGICCALWAVSLLIGARKHGGL